MPFQKTDYLETYPAEQLAIFRAAYEQICDSLGACPTEAENKDQLEHTIIRIYDSGITTAPEIARLIIQIETLRP